MIRHPDRHAVLTTVPPGQDPGIDEAIQRNRMAYGEGTNARGERIITAAMPISNTNWLVAIRYPESEAYAPLREARWFFALGLLFALALTLLAIWFLIRHITHPLFRLTAHVRALPAKEGKDRLITWPPATSWRIWQRP